MSEFKSFPSFNWKPINNENFQLFSVNSVVHMNVRVRSHHIVHFSSSFYIVIVLLCIELAFGLVVLWRENLLIIPLMFIVEPIIYWKSNKLLRDFHQILPSPVFPHIHEQRTLYSLILICFHFMNRKKIFIFFCWFVSYSFSSLFIRGKFIHGRLQVTLIKMLSTLFR